MSKGYFVRLLQDFNMRTVRIRILDEARSTELHRDGTWQPFEEMGVITDDVGIVIPAGAVEALAVAIEEFQGHTSHADTEARVLREWLAVEQRRVDAMLDKEVTP